MHPAYTIPWVVGLRINPNVDKPSLYFLQYGEDLLPVCTNNRILTCFSEAAIPKLLWAVRSQEPPPEWKSAVEFIYDLPSVMNVVTIGKSDVHAEVADFLYFLLDCMEVTNANIPEPYRNVLVGLSDCATFTKEVSEFLDSKPDIRCRVHQAIIWCLGWLFFNLHVVE